MLSVTATSVPATVTTAVASGSVGGISLHNPTWDAFIILFWIIVSIIYSFSAGRGRIISILVAVYMSELIVIQAPFLGNSAAQHLNLALYLGRLIVFLVMFLLFFLVLSKYVFRTSLEHRGMSSWLFSFLFSLLQVGFLISVVLSFLPVATQQTFSTSIQTLFITSTAQFIWLLLPMVFLVVAGRLVKERLSE
jgi:hypothetical protein